MGITALHGVNEKRRHAIFGALCGFALAIGLAAATWWLFLAPSERQQATKIRLLEQQVAAVKGIVDAMETRCKCPMPLYDVGRPKPRRRPGEGETPEGH